MCSKSCRRGTGVKEPNTSDPPPTPAPYTASTPLPITWSSTPGYGSTGRPLAALAPAGLPNHAARLSGVVVVAKVLPSGAVRDRRVGRGRGTLGSGV